MAELAGTSPTVVSYVVNEGPRNVAPATRARVLAAIEEVGYRPNRTAQALASRRSNTLGLVVPDTTNAFFRELCEEVQRAAFALDRLALVASSTFDDELERSYIQTFLDANVDGLIVVDELVPESLPDGTQIVSLHKGTSSGGSLAVQTADEDSAAELTNHLLDHGHTNVWCFAGMEDVGAIADRVSGWRSALAGRGISPADHTIIRSIPRSTDASSVFAEVLSGTDRPTAIFVVTDEQAIGVLHAAHVAGLNVPNDLAVASFDGTSASAVTVPPLTTAVVPIKAMADAAVRLAARLVPEPASLTFTPELCIRQSCGCS